MFRGMPDTAFDPSSTDSLQGRQQMAAMDSLLRTSMTEVFLSQAYTSMSLQLLLFLREDFSSMSDQEFLASREGMTSFIDVMLDLACVADQGHSRLFGAVCAAFTHNKVSFRDLVLGKFVGPDVTRHQLRGSDFLDKNLFGDLPVASSKS